MNRIHVKIEFVDGTTKDFYAFSYAKRWSDEVVYWSMDEAAEEDEGGNFYSVALRQIKSYSEEG